MSTQPNQSLASPPPGVVASRFWGKVDKTTPEGCWLWTDKLVSGYGQFAVKLAPGVWKTFYAHKVAYELCIGPLPEKTALRHSCPNFHCVNPAHLIPGRKRMTDEEFKVRLIERFWRFVDKTPGHGPKGECWVWTGGKLKGTHGYGMMIGAGEDRKGHFYTHRFSYELHHGSIPDGLHVLHRCDYPSCVRPEHLFAGTAKDNAQDAKAKGRLRAAGMRRRKNKVLPAKAVRLTLTPRQGAMVRDARVALGLTQPVVAATIGVDVTHYSRLEKGHPSRSLYLEQLHGLLAYLRVDVEAFDVSECGRRETLIRLESPGHKKMGGTFLPYLRFGQTGPLSSAKRRARFKTLPAPDITHYRADLIRFYLNRSGDSFSKAATGAGMSDWSFKKVLMGENCRRSTVMRLAGYVGLKESEVFNVQAAKVA